MAPPPVPKYQLVSSELYGRLGDFVLKKEMFSE